MKLNIPKELCDACDAASIDFEAERIFHNYYGEMEPSVEKFVKSKHYVNALRNYANHLELYLNECEKQARDQIASSSS